MDDSVIKVRDRESIEDSIEVAVKYNLLSLPVVDEKDRLCGIVIMSDIIDEVLMPSWRKKSKKVS
jgi:Mg/Co/Ni transporter MgtE